MKLALKRLVSEIMFVVKSFSKLISAQATLLIFLDDLRLHESENTDINCVRHTNSYFLHSSVSIAYEYNHKKSAEN